jgi:hypothetical protein
MFVNLPALMFPFHRTAAAAGPSAPRGATTAPRSATATAAWVAALRARVRASEQAANLPLAPRPATFADHEAAPAATLPQGAHTDIASIEAMSQDDAAALITSAGDRARGTTTMMDAWPTDPVARLIVGAHWIATGQVDVQRHVGPIDARGQQLDKNGLAHFIVMADAKRRGEVSTS